MTHKNCGGEIYEDKRKRYIYYVGNKKEIHYSQKCKKCNKEILGDCDIILGIGGNDD